MGECCSLTVAAVRDESHEEITASAGEGIGGAQVGDVSSDGCDERGVGVRTVVQFHRVASGQPSKK